MVKWLAAWSVLIAVFLLAGEGINLIRIYFLSYVAYGATYDLVVSILGLLLTLLCVAFLAGFVYSRDKRRHRVPTPQLPHGSR